MKIVCDTNILISALLFPGGPPDQVLNLARLRTALLFLSPEILAEFRGVLARKFRYAEKEVAQFVDRVVAIAQMVYPTERLHRITRVEADNRILECAAEAGVDYLITGDPRDLLPLKSHGKTRIVTAREFVEIVTTIPAG